MLGDLWFQIWKCNTFPGHDYIRLKPTIWATQGINCYGFFILPVLGHKLETYNFVTQLWTVTNADKCYNIHNTLQITYKQ